MNAPGPATTFWEPLPYHISWTHLLKITKTQGSLIFYSFATNVRNLDIFIILAF